MEENFLNLKKKYSVMDHLHRKWKFASEMSYNPKVEYAIRYYILVRLNKIRHKYKDTQIKDLCKKIIKKLTDLQKRHQGVEANFAEVQKLVLEEFKFCKNELNTDIIYPELVYRFYHIATLFEVLTVYDDIDEKTKNLYLDKAKTSTDFALKTKKKLKNVPISHISRYSLFTKNSVNTSFESLGSGMQKMNLGGFDLSSYKMKGYRISKFDLNEVFSY